MLYEENVALCEVHYLKPGVYILPFCAHKCAGKVSCERKDWEEILAIKTKFMKFMKSNEIFTIWTVSFPLH